MRIVLRSAAQKIKAHKAKAHDAHIPSAYVMAVDVTDIPADARHQKIRRIFESPLGCYVSEATLSQNGVHIVLHVSAEKMTDVYAQLGKLLPDALIHDIRPRDWDFLPNRAAS